MFKVAVPLGLSKPRQSTSKIHLKTKCIFFNWENQQKAEIVYFKKHTQFFKKLLREFIRACFFFFLFSSFHWNELCRILKEKKKSAEIICLWFKSSHDRILNRNLNIGPQFQYFTENVKIFNILPQKDDIYLKIAIP